MNEETNDQVELRVQEIIVDMLMKQIDQDVKQAIGIQYLIDLVTGLIVGNRVD